MLRLYDYYRSGAAYRARIALNLKGLEYEQVAIHLTSGGGEQFDEKYTKINPQNLVPTLVDGDFQLAQSMAIMEYLEDSFPLPNILPTDPKKRAKARALANLITCDIHPLNNLRVRLYLVDRMGISDSNRKIWIEHWIRLGFESFETLLLKDGLFGPYSVGEQPSVADICLIPQLANARLNKIDLSNYPNILEIEKTCQKHPAFEKALPENQPDSE
ncbi:MAG: maleylacetoacetate isomerase [Pseudomonadota bacterium]|nr:maleylacetoacetate isomerase [Pseudomonadota bacterium]